MIEGNRPIAGPRDSLARATPRGVTATVVAFVVAGCGARTADSGNVGADAGAGSDCALSLAFDPATPIAGPTTTIRASAIVTHAFGVPGYTWSVRFNGATVDVTPAQSDSSEIDFRAPTPGTYSVSLDVTGVPTSCSSAFVPLNVRAPGAQSELFRLRVVPPQTVAAPPLEKGLVIDGGASADLGVVSLDRGILVTPQVKGLVNGSSGGIPGYLRFAPNGAPDAVVEGFADSSGYVMARLLPEPHMVLIVPSVAGIAPRRITSWSPGSTVLAVDAGSTITGTVRDPANAPLAGATVQLSIDGVPSTLAMTAGDGSFTVHAVTASQAAVVVEITPPNASGLPRLSATSQAFDLGVPLQIRYAANLALQNLAGLPVRRNGTPVANAQVMVVGSLAAAGTVTAGTSADATGDVRISASAGATGTLPSTLVPSAALSAVVTVAPGDLAVAALDTTTAVPANLDAAPGQRIVATLQDPAGAGMRGAVLDLVPAGALAMAAAPTLHVTADTSGAITAVLAAGGHYDLRFHDPAGRAAPLVVADRVATTVATTYRLPIALQVHGRLVVDGTQALANASVQILCDACTGIEREKPIAEVASDETGQFTLAVPDPGIM